MYSRRKILAVAHEIANEAKTTKPYVFIAQPRRDLRETPAQSFGGYRPPHIDLRGFSHRFCDIGGKPVDVARNYLIERAIESEAKYLFFVGEDTVIPFDGFMKLHDTAEKDPNSVVSGVYYFKLSVPMVMVRNEGYVTPANVDPGQIIEAWLTGMDAMLIPTAILRRMKGDDPELPFCCVIDVIGEDNFFVHRLHRMGVRLLVNTDVQCLHVDLASGKYTAHPGVRPGDYLTNIAITTPFVPDDREYIERRWTDRLPEATSADRIYERTTPIKGSPFGP